MKLNLTKSLKYSMRGNLCRFLFSILLSIYTISSFSQHNVVYNDVGYYYDEDKGIAYVQSVSPSLPNVVIPKHLSFDYYLRNYMGTIYDTIYVDADVVRIVGGALADSNIETIDIQAKVIIEQGAFRGCKKLTDVTFSLSGGVSELRFNAFKDCSNLTNVHWGNNSTLTKIDDSTFKGCTSLKSISLPQSIDSIGYDAFYNCTGLTTVNFPQKLKSIGVMAFYKCIGLKTLTLPQSLENIENGAFWGCTGLMSVNLPSNIHTIEASTFSGCTGLTSVTIPYNVTNIKDCAFSDCSGLKSVTIPNSVTGIGAYSFHGCSGLTSITIPNSVESISYDAFSGCSSLKTVEIHNNDTLTILNRAFDNCNNIKEVSCRDISKWCLIIFADSTANPTYYSHNLRIGKPISNIKIPWGIKRIYSYAFINVDDMRRIDLPTSLEHIGQYAFNSSNADIYKVQVRFRNAIETSYNIFNERTYQNARLRVPTLDCVDEFRNTYCWSKFKNIFPIGHYDFTFEKLVDWDATLIEFLESLGLEDWDTNKDGVLSLGDGSFDLPETTDEDYWPIWTSSNTDVVAIDGYTLTIVGPGTTTISVSILDDDDRVLAVKEFTLTVAENPKPDNTNIQFADAAVKAICVTNWDTDGDGELSKEEAAQVTNIGQIFLSNDEITSFDELQYFTGLTSLGLSTFYACTGLKSIIIPKSVTSIGQQAFYNCSGLTSVNIPNGVTSIGKNAFSGCKGLTSLTIPNSVTSIGEQAFYNCSGLTSVSIGNSVTSIGSYAFYGCSSLTKAEFASVECLCNIEFGDYNANPLSSTKHLYVNGQEIKDLIIPESVTSIGKNAFSGCSGLTSVTIPNSVTSIGSEAFVSCSSLTSVVIPNSVTSIDKYAFSVCKGLKSVTFGNSVASIGEHAFQLCSVLKEVWCMTNQIPSTGSDVFLYSNTAHATLYVPTSSIDAYKSTSPWDSFGTILPIEDEEPDEGNRINGIYYSFDSETNTATVTSGELKYTDDIVIPETVTYLGNTYIVTSIGDSAFKECANLTSVTIPSGVINIGFAAFRKCSKLTSINIPNSVTSIEDRAFQDCRSLTTIIIPNSVISIGLAAFFDTAWYNEQPNGLVYAGKVAYIYKGTMPGETHITLDEGTLGIAGYAFNNCSGLTSVAIPNSVACIGDGAFGYCSNLTSVTCYAEKVPSTGINCFTSVPQSSATLCVPSSSINAYKSAFQWSSFGTILPIEDEEPYKPFSTTMAYYLYNEEADLYFCPGNSWDTQASVGEAGMDLLFEDVAGQKECFFIGDIQCAAYAVNTQIYNSATAHYLGLSGDGASAYFDQEPATWYFVPQEDGTFLLSSNTTGNYLYYDGVHTALAITSDATQKGTKWHVMTREDIISKMETATEVEPVNVSSLISYADFSRNGKMRVGVWQGNPSRGGNNDNFCAEKFDCNFDVYQILTGLPNGVYKVKAQAYYREGADQNYNPIPAVELRKNGNEHLYAKLYANNEEKPVQSIFDEVDNCTIGYQTELGFVPNSVSSAATTFLQGLYWNELLTEVTDGTLQLGIRKNEYVFYDWTCFDSFRLYYYGNDSLSVPLERLSMSTDSATFDVYDFCGHKVRTATNTLDDLPMGVYIVGSKGQMRKVVVR